MENEKKPILKVLSGGLRAFIIIATAGVAFFIAYIMFAPDTWPKPFYLVYRYPTSAEAASPETPPEEAPAEHASTPAEPPPSVPLEIRPGQGLMVDTGSKIVNLAEPTGRRYIKVNIILEFAPTDLEFYTMAKEEETAYVESFNEEINGKLPVINDLLVTLLSSQTFESVYTAEGKESLRDEIMTLVNGRLPEYRVIFVYFTEFVVQ